MQFTKTMNNTWNITFNFTEKPIYLVAFKDQESQLISQSYIDIDTLDGSCYDSDGDEKQLLVTINDNELIFETLIEDYEFWKGTEQCYKQGCLGYVADILKNAIQHKNFTIDATPLESEYDEVFLWNAEYVKQEYPQLF